MLILLPSNDLLGNFLVGISFTVLPNLNTTANNVQPVTASTPMVCLAHH